MIPWILLILVVDWLYVGWLGGRLMQEASRRHWPGWSRDCGGNGVFIATMPLGLIALISVVLAVIATLVSSERAVAPARSGEELEGA